MPSARRSEISSPALGGFAVKEQLALRVLGIGGCHTHTRLEPHCDLGQQRR